MALPPLHYLCEKLFVPPSETEVRAMASNIQRVGQLYPALRWRGQIISGRRRLLACAAAGVEPWIEDLPDDADVAGLVEGLDLCRRHDTKGDLVISAGLLAKWITEQRRAGVANLPGGRATEHAAEDSGLSSKTVTCAVRVLETGDDALIESVRSGDVAVSAAAKLAKLSPEERVRVLEGGETVARRQRAAYDRSVMLARVGKRFRACILDLEQDPGAERMAKGIARYLEEIEGWLGAEQA